MNITDKANANNKETIIISDLNINYLKNNDLRNLKDNTTFLGSNEMVYKPTRVTKDSETLLIEFSRIMLVTFALLTRFYHILVTMI